MLHNTGIGPEIAGCLGCGRSIKTQTRYPRKYPGYCRAECHARANRPAIVRSMSTTTVGAISEYRVCIDLLQRGYEVFRAVSPSCKCDIMASRGDDKIRVEVKTAAYRRDGRPAGGTAAYNRFDVLALVLPEQVVYVPALPSAVVESQNG